MDSTTMRSAQIHFIDEPLKLIHIPISSYSKYVQPLLQILHPLPGDLRSSDGTISEFQPDPSTPWMNRHPFLNLSITPVECSIFCARSLARHYFAPFLPASSPHSSKRPLSSKGTSSSTEQLPTMSSDDFVAISIDSQDGDAGQRVLELTTPLALAGISIFFITTYFSDYILVSSKARSKVVSALEARGFKFSKDHGFGSMHSPTSSISHSSQGLPRSSHHRNTSSSSSLSNLLSNMPPNGPKSPPPTSLSDLRARTSALLKRHDIVPTVHRDLLLHHCAASDSSDFVSSQLQIGLMQCLAHPPRFLSLTLTGTEPASLLLDKSTRQRFSGRRGSRGGGGGRGAGYENGNGNGNGAYDNGGGGEGEVGYLMSGGDVLVPVMLDLSPLGEGSTGIVCGVAGRLVDGQDDDDDMGFSGASDGPGGIEMSYLSTARGAAVLVDESLVEEAVARLRQGESGMDVI